MTSRPETSRWSAASWRQFPAAQQPDWPDADALKKAEARLSTLPPLVFAGEARLLTAQLAEVANGEAFLLQAGDCAESFAEFTADSIRDKLKIILQMAVALTYAAGVPVVKVGPHRRTVRQAAHVGHRARSATWSCRSFRGHMVNDEAFEGEARHTRPRAARGRLPAVGVHAQPAAGLHQGRLRRPLPGPPVEPAVRRVVRRGAALRAHRVGDRPGPAVHGRLRHRPRRGGGAAPGRLLHEPRGADPPLRGVPDPASTRSPATGTTARPTCCGWATGPGSSTAPTSSSSRASTTRSACKVGPSCRPTKWSPCASGSTPIDCRDA